MLAVYQLDTPQIRPVEQPTGQAWLNLTRPTHTELQDLEEQYAIPMDLLTAALDPDSRPRYEMEEGVLLIIVRVPIANDQVELSEEDEEPIGVPYVTRPLGILLAGPLIITVCSKPTTVLTDFLEHKVKGIDPARRTHFVLQILYRTALKYLRFLRDIELSTNRVEKDLLRTLRNEELVRLMNHEKSLVYFNTSIRSNHILLERLRNSRFFEVVEEDDRELLEDILIDNSQAMEVAGIYAKTVNGLMEACSSVINNNLNQVLKRLTKVTILLMIPTLVVSIYGMNLPLPGQGSTGTLPIVLAAAALGAVLGAVLFNLKRLR